MTVTPTRPVIPAKAGIQESFNVPNPDSSLIQTLANSLLQIFLTFSFFLASLFHQYNKPKAQMLHRITKSLTLVFFLLSQFLSIGFAYAQDAASLPITPDGTTSTFVTQTASGIDQVNIAAPNSSGLSHNKFENYNVNTSGQILNNFSGAATDVD